MNRFIVAFFSFSLLLVVGCKDNPADKYPTLDLLKYGLPIDIKAPANAEVNSNDLGVIKDVTVKNDEGYSIQIYSSTANELDATKIKSELISEVKGGPFFSKIVEEYEDGFIFEKKIDERINYGFRYVKIQGDFEYIFQTGLMGHFSEDDVRNMYNSVSGATK